MEVCLRGSALWSWIPAWGGYFRNSPRYANWPNGFFSGLNTALATAIPPAAVYAVGLARKDSYAQGTSLLAREAVADSELVSVGDKECHGRQRYRVPLQCFPLASWTGNNQMGFGS
jgi:hypothetical protein